MKVSVIIPTYNRFKYLLNTIKSVQAQTYKNIEIIVVNDCSTQDEYYTYNWTELNNSTDSTELSNSTDSIKIIHLEQNSKQLFGYACAGYVRNQGILVASGEYISFCDDDDSWFPNKIELQMDAMQKTGCKMSCTDGLIGSGPFNSDKLYQKYNAEYYYNELRHIYKNSGFLENGFPEIWTLPFLKIHNCVICSSVIIKREILDKIHNMNNVRNGQEDYDCWIRAMENTDCVYVKDICFYYDVKHGDGSNHTNGF